MELLEDQDFHQLNFDFHKQEFGFLKVSRVNSTSTSTLIVTSVVSVLPPPSVAVTVTEYAFDDAADPGAYNLENLQMLELLLKKL